jgi:hypothetical protein
MARKVADDKNVAYFENHDAVTETGFYIVEKEADENHGEIKVGRRVAPDADGEGWVYASDSDE